MYHAGSLFTTLCLPILAVSAGHYLPRCFMRVCTYVDCVHKRAALYKIMQNTIDTALPIRVFLQKIAKYYIVTVNVK